MSADFTKPSVTSIKTSFPTEIKDNDDALAQMFHNDLTSANKPTNTKRIDNNGNTYYWDGATWQLIGAIGSNPVDDTAYGAGWDGDTTTSPSKNAVYDEIESVKSSIPSLDTDAIYVKRTTFANGDSGTFTPNSSTNAIRILMAGGGGGGGGGCNGGGAGGGGASGAFKAVLMNLNTDYFTISYSVGNRGTGGAGSSSPTTATSGTNGTDTTLTITSTDTDGFPQSKVDSFFGLTSAVLTAGGGNGGAGGQSVAGGAGGTNSDASAGNGGQGADDSELAGDDGVTPSGDIQFMSGAGGIGTSSGGGGGGGGASVDNIGIMIIPPLSGGRGRFDDDGGFGFGSSSGCGGGGGDGGIQKTGVAGGHGFMYIEEFSSTEFA